VTHTVHVQFDFYRQADVVTFPDVYYNYHFEYNVFISNLLYIY